MCECKKNDKYQVCSISPFGQFDSEPVNPYAQAISDIFDQSTVHHLPSLACWCTEPMDS